jgi:putative transposase
LHIQLCIVHMVRNSMTFVPWRDYKEVAGDLKSVYRSATEEEALRELDQVEEKWSVKYHLITRSWRQNWDNLNTLFAYPPAIRRAIYTTNSIESLNSVIRKAIKKRKLFLQDDAAKQVVYLVTRETSKRWTMPIHNWRAALNHFIIFFEDRLSDHI